MAYMSVVFVYMVLSIFTLASGFLLRRWNNPCVSTLEGMKKEYITAYEYNPEFFPTTVEELAVDAFDSIQLGLISKINRLRIDIRLNIVEKERNLLLFLVKLSNLLVDDEISRVRVVTRTSLVDKIKSVSNEVADTTLKDKVFFSSLTDFLGYSFTHLLSRLCLLTIHSVR